MRKELDAKSIGRVFVSLVFLVAGFFIMDLWVPSGVAIWVTAALMLLHKQREEKIRHLTGLLPMCALCKKIRDDQGLWSQVEQYFEEHYADLQFTHGLCPACSRQLYPGLFPRLSEKHPEAYKEAR